jgi:hypothetical protein
MDFNFEISISVRKVYKLFVLWVFLKMFAYFDQLNQVAIREIDRKWSLIL